MTYLELSPYVEPFDGITEAFAHIRDAVVEFANAMHEVIKQLAEYITNLGNNLFDQMLRIAATPKEWHLMHHAKRFRVRKKYRNRVVRRLLAVLSEDADECEEDG